MSSPAKIIEHEPPHQVALASSGAAALTPMDMLERAISGGANIEVLTKLMDLQERWERNQAKKAFDEAMAAAKSEITGIKKNRAVDFTSQKGRTNYRHEDLGEIARTVDPVLSKYGLSYRWRTLSPPSEPVTVTCIVSHRQGHSEENTLSAGRDETGNKNGIQAIGSTITYLQRYTLKAALGLAASNDDDGNGGAENRPGRTFVTDEQVDQIRNLLIETKSNVVLFLKTIKVESLTEIYADKFDDVMNLIRETAKKRAAREQGGQA